MRKKLGKMFFDGVSKVFEGPNNAGNLKRATRVATIGGTKAKAKLSQATKKFKAKIAGIEDGIKTAAKKFKGRIDDKKIKSVAKEIKNKNKSKVIKEFLREPKMGGGMMGRQMYKKGSKKAVGKKSNFGMLSVKAGIDNNPNPTQADRIAGAKMKKGKK